MEAIIDEYISQNKQTNERYKDYYKYIIKKIIETFNILFDDINIDNIYDELNNKDKYNISDCRLNIDDIIISFLKEDGSTEYEFCIKQLIDKFKQQTYNFLQYLHSEKLKLLNIEKYNKYTKIKNRYIKTGFFGNLSDDQLHIKLSLCFFKNTDVNTLNIYFSDLQYNNKLNDVNEYKKFIQYYNDTITIHDNDQFSKYIQDNCNMNDKCSCEYNKDTFYFKFEFNYIFNYVTSYILKYQNNSLYYVKKFVGDRSYINIEKIHWLHTNNNTIYLETFNF